MRSFPVIEPLQQLFDQHAIPYTMEEDWLVPYHDFEQYPAIRMLWFPYDTNGCLQVEVFHSDQTLMIECFAGIGESSDEAIPDALKNFCINSFHVFAVAFWGLKPDDQVDVIQWQIQDKNYTVYLGAMGTRLINLDTFPELPNHWFEQLQAQIEQESDLDHLAWFRLFVGNNQGELTVEVLKNNDVWDEMQNTMCKLDWVLADGYYSIRQFMILKEN
ncbi:DUF6348 family protein [Acinetobacter larvae]|nr:DUF6348 family protein [Acinetobacter larvae]